MNDSMNGLFPEAGEQNKAEILHIALLSAYAVALHSIETFIPKPLPWLRFGLANIVTLTTLILYGLKAGMTVTLIRVFVGGLVTGTFLGPAFVLSAGGGISSTLVMWAAGTVPGRLFSPVGLSLLGAFAHNIAQLFLAYALFIRNMQALLFISPIILLIGVVTGCVNGAVTVFVIKKIRG